MAQPEQTSYLYGGLDKLYLEAREKFEAERSSEHNRKLFQRIQAIIKISTQGSSDNIHCERGTTVDGDKITVTTAGLLNQDLKIGESEVKRQTDWIPSGARKVKLYYQLRNYVY